MLVKKAMSVETNANIYSQGQNVFALESENLQLRKIERPLWLRIRELTSKTIYIKNNRTKGNSPLLIL